MNKRLYIEWMVELSHKDTWVHYYFAYYKIFAMFSFLRNVDYIAKFKAELRKRKYISQVPKHYQIGPRKLNIILTQIRCFALF
jgi:hypothetical protein